MSREPTRLSPDQPREAPAEQRDDPRADPRDDLNLLRPWREPIPRARFLTDALGSLLFHSAIIIVLLSLPDGAPPVRSPQAIDVRKSTPLYLPRELTQRDPNKGQVSRSLDVRSA